MRNFLHFLAVAGVVLLASSIDAISALIFSNPITAFFAHIILFFFLALMVAVFIVTVKRILNTIEGNDR